MMPGVDVMRQLIFLLPVYRIVLVRVCIFYILSLSSLPVLKSVIPLHCNFLDMTGEDHARYSTLYPVLAVPRY